MTSISISTITRCGTTGDFTRATPQSVAVMQLGGTLTTPGISRSHECRISAATNPAGQYIETWLTRGWTTATINDALRGGDAHKLTPAQVESHLSICIGSMNGWNTLVRWTRSQAGDAPTLADWAEEAFGSMLADVQQAIDMGHFMASLKAGGTRSRSSRWLSTGPTLPRASSARPSTSSSSGSTGTRCARTPRSSSSA